MSHFGLRQRNPESMKHFIGRQTIEVVIRQKAGAFEWQQTLSRRFQEDIAPALAVLFDSLSEEDEHLRIDKLEIDLGVISEKEILSGTWVQKIVAQLETSLQRALQKANLGKQKSSAALRGFELWLHFLRHGSLPRFSAAPPENWQKELLDTLGLQASAANQLRDVLQRSPSALNRLVLQYPTAFLVHIVELFTGKGQQDLNKALLEIKAVFLKIAGRRTSAQTAQELASLLPMLFPAQFSQKNPPNAAEIQAFFKKSMPRTFRELELRFWRKILHILFASGYRAAPRDYLRLLFREEPSFRAMVPLMNILYKKDAPLESLLLPIIQALAPVSEPKSATKAKAIPKPRLTDAPKFEETQKDTSKLETPEANEDGWHIETAGIVLVHPFLATFFKNRDLIDPAGTAFRDEWCQQKALQLMHFLATGAEGPAEHQLTLAKLLCGIPLEYPADGSALLSSEDKAAADALLEAVVAHWGALGNTSPDGLREGFFLREAKLSKQGMGFRLQVERKTIDILLDKIPWGLGVVKTPWMKEMLFVEWN